MHRRRRSTAFLFVFTLFLLSCSAIFAQNNSVADLVVTSSIPNTPCCVVVDCDPYTTECAITTWESCVEKGGFWVEGEECGYACMDPC